jgi:hypothetical protein
MCNLRASADIAGGDGSGTTGRRKCQADVVLVPVPVPVPVSVPAAVTYQCFRLQARTTKNLQPHAASALIT